MRSPVVQVGIILLITLTVFFTNLGTPRLWDWDEPRNAGCAAEMLERGDWVVPIFNQQLRRHKPALLYWLMMSAYSVFGVTEFAARFWSATLAVGTCLGTYAIGRRLYDDRVGFLAAIALATSMMFVVAARAATPDSVLVFCGTMSLMFFVLGAFPKHDVEANSKLEPSSPSDWFPKNNLIVIAMYLTMGLGVLAKGPIGFLLPMAMIGMYGLLKTLTADETKSTKKQSFLARTKTGLWRFVRSFNPMHFGEVLWAMRPLTATALILLVSLPWFVLVHIRTEGDFTQLFFVGEHFGRATTAMENHSGGVWFYPVMILIGFFPWSCFWGPVLVGLVPPTAHDKLANSRLRDANCFLLCWICVQVGAFTIAQTKLPSYVTPCYPALAILTASCFVSFASRLKTQLAGQSGVPKIWFYAAFAGLGIGGILIPAGVYLGTEHLLPSPIASQERISDVAALGYTQPSGIKAALKQLSLLGLIPIVASGVLLFALWQKRYRWLIPVYSITAVIFAIALFAYGAVVADRHRECMTILNEAKNRPGQLATYGCLESTWIFYSGKPITELIVEPKTQLAPVGTFAFTRPQRKFWKPVPPLFLKQFVNSNERYLIITTNEFADGLLARLPPEFSQICESDYFLENKRLCLIGNSDTVAPDSRP